VLYGTGWLLPLHFGIVHAVGFGLITRPMVAAAIVRRFQANRGVVSGIGTAGWTVGQLLPAVTALMLSGARRPAFLLLAAARAVLTRSPGMHVLPARPPATDTGSRPPAPAWTPARNPVLQAIFWRDDRRWMAAWPPAPAAFPRLICLMRASAFVLLRNVGTSYSVPLLFSILFSLLEHPRWSRT
jgi:hypothetical protein